jgi:hypothetical protein
VPLASVEETVILDAIAMAGAESREVTKKDIRNAVRAELERREAAQRELWGDVLQALQGFTKLAEPEENIILDASRLARRTDPDSRGPVFRGSAQK